MRERVSLVQIHGIKFVKDMRAANTAILCSGQSRTACVLFDFLACDKYHQ